jgi:uncharacterized coiled-coil protein SlyX
MSHSSSPYQPSYSSNVTIEDESEPNSIPPLPSALLDTENLIPAGAFDSVIQQYQLRKLQRLNQQNLALSNGANSGGISLNHSADGNLDMMIDLSNSIVPSYSSNQNIEHYHQNNRDTNETDPYSSREKQLQELIQKHLANSAGDLYAAAGRPSQAKPPRPNGPKSARNTHYLSNTQSSVQRKVTTPKPRSSIRSSVRKTASARAQSAKSTRDHGKINGKRRVSYGEIPSQQGFGSPARSKDANTLNVDQEDRRIWTPPPGLTSQGNKIDKSPFKRSNFLNSSSSNHTTGSSRINNTEISAHHTGNPSVPHRTYESATENLAYDGPSTYEIQKTANINSLMRHSRKSGANKASSHKSKRNLTSNASAPAISNSEIGKSGENSTQNAELLAYLAQVNAKKLEERLKQTQLRMEGQSNSISALQSALTSKNEEISHKEKQIKLLQQQIKAQNYTIGPVNDYNQQVLLNAALEKRVIQLESAVSSKENKISDLKLEKTRDLESHSRLNQRIKSLEEQLEHFSGVEQRVLDLKAELKQSKKANKALRSEFSHKKNEFSTELSHSREKLAVLAQETAQNKAEESNQMQGTMHREKKLRELIVLIKKNEEATVGRYKKILNLLLKRIDLLINKNSAEKQQRFRAELLQEIHQIEAESDAEASNPAKILQNKIEAKKNKRKLKQNNRKAARNGENSVKAEELEDFEDSPVEYSHAASSSANVANHSEAREEKTPPASSNSLLSSAAWVNQRAELERQTILSGLSYSNDNPTANHSQHSIAEEKRLLQLLQDKLAQLTTNPNSNNSSNQLS